MKHIEILGKIQNNGVTKTSKEKLFSWLNARAPVRSGLWYLSCWGRLLGRIKKYKEKN
jgi:hypothetical protein